MHLESLTGLRSVAALLVLLHHVAVLRPDLPSLWPAELGYVGVTFFFVLSGFVLTYSWNGAQTMGEFYVKRLARVYPLHLVMVVVMLLIDQAAPSIPSTVANASLVHAWWPQQSVAYSLVGASWSLSCEAFFYALFPLAVVAVAAVRRPLLQAGVLASSMVAVAAFTASTTGVGSYFFHLPMVRLSDFLMGMLSCVAMRQGWRPRPGVGGLVGMLGAAYAMLWWLQHETLTGTDRQWLFSAILAAPFAVLICACAARDLDGRPVALASRAWVRMGRWSFALYLVHGPVLSILRDPLLVASGWDAGLTIASVIVVSVAAAVVLHETIEAPMERWIRRAWLRRGTLGVETSPSTAVS